MRWQLATPVLAVSSMPGCQSSAGGRDPAYRACVAARGDAYNCMMEISRERLRRGLPLLQ